MRISLAVAIAALILAAGTNAPAKAAEAWFVVMGSFPEDSPAADQRAAEIERDCDLSPDVGDGADFSGMNSDVTFVYLGPYTSRSGADADLGEAKDCIADSYVKSATPLADTDDDDDDAEDGDDGGEDDGDDGGEDDGEDED